MEKTSVERVEELLSRCDFLTQEELIEYSEFLPNMDEEQLWEVEEYLTGELDDYERLKKEEEEIVKQIQSIKDEINNEMRNMQKNLEKISSESEEQESNSLLESL